jgi:protoporphyrinogen oxidase
MHSGEGEVGLSGCHGVKWLLLDAAPAAGGLACTDITPEGFLFDMGGHVIFSHYDYFDQLLDAALGGSGPEQWAVHERVSYVW